MRTAFASLACLGLPMLLAGCGDAEKSADGGGSIRGVIASASDCVSFGPDAVKACAEAIERAVERHEESSTRYSNLDLCEKDVGQSKCERAETGHYRPRLSAFIVTIGKKANAEPLYPATSGTVGFQTADKSVLLADDRSLSFSSLAASVAEMQAAQGATGRRRQRL